MNGADGRWRDSLRSTLATLKVPDSRALTIFAASSPLPTSAFFAPVRSRRALNGGGWSAWRSAPRIQYSSETKASISSWRSQTILRATDCTRPADSPCLTFSQRSGERRKPIIRSSTRRACWASTLWRSIWPGLARAWSTARRVISLKVTRRTDSGSFSRTSAMCHAMASPSRSGSGAR